MGSHGGVFLPMHMWVYVYVECVNVCMHARMFLCMSVGWGDGGGVGV